MNLNLKLTVTIVTKDMSKEELIRQYQLLIHKTTVDNSKGAPFKIRHYADTMKLLTNFPNETLDDIEELEEWFKLNGKKNPSKIMDNVREFLDKGYLPQAKDAMDNPVVKAVVNLTKVANIGPAKAKELQSKYGITTVEELKAKFKSDSSIIHSKQQIGLKYHDDLLTRIPRDEMIEYNKTLGNICKSISSDMMFSINGSFRREHSSSGDIDVLISGPSGKNKEFRDLFISKLKDLGIVKEILASGKKKFMGIAKLEGYSSYRHIDIIDTELEQYPFAQLYFTGSGGFNSHMRLIALKKGYSMNEYCISDKKTKKPVSSEDIMAKIKKERFETEEDIFSFIELDYVEPKCRNTTTLSKVI
jgi:DNA polymerase/3'-5' exonuclease PolX